MLYTKNYTMNTITNSKNVADSGRTIFSSIKEKFLKLSFIVRWGISALVILFIFICGYFFIKSDTTSYEILASSLNSSESKRIAQYLDTKQTPYKQDAKDMTIMVDKYKKSQILMELAENDLLPHSVSILPGYEIFDTQDMMGGNQFLQNLNQKRALEGEIARTIGKMDNVQSVRIHINLAQEDLYGAADPKNTVGVYLKLMPHKNLTLQQVKGIKKLLSASIPFVDETRVTLVDQNGTLIEENENSFVSENSQEKIIETKLNGIMNQCFGEGQAKVTVKINRIEKSHIEQSVLYQPEHNAIENIQTNNQEEFNRLQSHQKKEILGRDDHGHRHENNQKNISYKVSETKIYQETKANAVDNISIAVMIDGLYKLQHQKTEKILYVSRKEIPEDLTLYTMTYVPRSEQELEAIKVWVTQAAGLNLSRGDSVEVINFCFYKPIQETEHRKIDSLTYAHSSFLSHFLGTMSKNTLFLFIGLMIFIISCVVIGMWWIISSRRTKGKKNLHERLLSVEKNDEALLHNKNLMHPAQVRLNELAQKHPQLIAKIVKQWLK